MKANKHMKKKEHETKGVRGVSLSVKESGREKSGGELRVKTGEDQENLNPTASIMPSGWPKNKK